MGVNNFCVRVLGGQGLYAKQIGLYITYDGAGMMRMPGLLCIFLPGSGALYVE